MKNSDKHENQNTTNKASTGTSTGTPADVEPGGRESKGDEGGVLHYGERCLEDTAMTKEDQERERAWDKEIGEQCKWDEYISRKLDREDRDNEVEDKEEGEE